MDEVDEQPQQLGLYVLQDIAHGFDDGSLEVRAAKGAEHGNPEIRSLFFEFAVPSFLESGPALLCGVSLAEVPQVVLGQEVLVALPHQGRHPGEGQDGKYVRVLVRTFEFIAKSIVVAEPFRHEPFQGEFDRCKTDTDAEHGEICHVLFVYILLDQRAQFYAEGDENEQPVEEYDAVWVSRSPMLDVLYVEYDAQGDNRDDGGPKPKVTSPNFLVVFDLEGRLERFVND